VESVVLGVGRVESVLWEWGVLENVVWGGEWWNLMCGNWGVVEIVVWVVGMV
jgi:hypothetical protein